MRKGSQQNGLKKTVEKSKVEFFHDDPEGEISHHNTPVAVNNINSRTFTMKRSSVLEHGTVRALDLNKDQISSSVGAHLWCPHMPAAAAGPSPASLSQPGNPHLGLPMEGTQTFLGQCDPAHPKAFSGRRSYDGKGLTWLLIVLASS